MQTLAESGNMARPISYASKGSNLYINFIFKKLYNKLQDIQSDTAESCSIFHFILHNALFPHRLCSVIPHFNIWYSINIWYSRRINSKIQYQTLKAKIQSFFFFETTLSVSGHFPSSCPHPSQPTGSPWGSSRTFSP